MEPAERAPKSARRASDPGGRPQGGTEERERKGKRKNGAFLVKGGTIGDSPLGAAARCPKSALV